MDLKKRPLQFSTKEMKAYQKGVDVQLAVDLVSHAYQDNFDVAVIFSGDADLLESIKLVKVLGKKVILISHPHQASPNMIKTCDYFYDLSRLNEASLNEISYIKN